MTGGPAMRIAEALVQAVERGQLEVDARRRWLRAAMDVFATHSPPRVFQFEHWPAWRTLLPHGQALLAGAMAAGVAPVPMPLLKGEAGVVALRLCATLPVARHFMPRKRPDESGESSRDQVDREPSQMSLLIVGFFAFKIIPTLVSAMCIYLGYRLFVMGVSGQASLVIDATRAGGSIKGQLLNAAPGLFFAVGGIVALIATIVKDTSVTASGAHGSLLGRLNMMYKGF